MNVQQNLHYQQARSYALKKLKKRVGKSFNLSELAIKSTVRRDVLERQSKLFGKFDARFVKTELDGSCLTGSAEQGILQLLEDPKFEFFDEQGFMAYNQCFRNEEVFNDDYHYEFDKLEGFLVSSPEYSDALKPQTVIHHIADQSNRIYHELIEMGYGCFEGYHFVVQETKQFKNDLIAWEETDINLVGHGINLETHSLVNYGGGLNQVFPISTFYNESANVFCFTIAAFPRFLKPLTESFK